MGKIPFTNQTNTNVQETLKNEHGLWRKKPKGKGSLIS
jgi:hypothetical protein